MSVCGCRVEQGGDQIFMGALWLRTECPTEIGHMLDFHLDCSTVQTDQNILSVCPPLPPVSHLFPSFNLFE